MAKDHGWLGQRSASRRFRQPRSWGKTGKPVTFPSQDARLVPLLVWLRSMTGRRLIPNNLASHLELPRLGHRLPKHAAMRWNSCLPCRGSAGSTRASAITLCQWRNSTPFGVRRLNSPTQSGTTGQRTSGGDYPPGKGN